jgi:hypothetical protein
VNRQDERHGSCTTKELGDVHRSRTIGASGPAKTNNFDPISVYGIEQRYAMLLHVTSLRKEFSGVRLPREVYFLSISGIQRCFKRKHHFLVAGFVMTWRSPWKVTKMNLSPFLTMLSHVYQNQPKLATKR